MITVLIKVKRQDIKRITTKASIRALRGNVLVTRDQRFAVKEKVAITESSLSGVAINKSMGRLLATTVAQEALVLTCQLSLLVTAKASDPVGVFLAIAFPSALRLGDFPSIKVGDVVGGWGWVHSLHHGIGGVGA